MTFVKITGLKDQLGRSRHLGVDVLTPPASGGLAQSALDADFFLIEVLRRSRPQSVVGEVVEAREGSFQSWLDDHDNAAEVTRFDVDNLCNTREGSGTPWLPASVFMRNPDLESFADLLVSNLDEDKKKRIEAVDLKTQALIAGGFTFVDPVDVIAEPGTGYAAGDEVTVLGGTGTRATGIVTKVSAEGAVEELVITNTGDYSKFPTGAFPSTSGGAGSGLQVRFVGAGTAMVGETFSLSPNAQVTFMGMNSAKDLLTYPLRVNNLDDSAVIGLSTPAAVGAFYLAGITRVRAALDTGTTLKEAIMAAGTAEDLAAVVDDR